MSKKKKKLLFISHDASLSGAPVLLLNLLLLLKEETDISYTIVIKRGGHLTKRFSAIGKTILLKPARRSGRENLFYKFIWLIKNKIGICRTIREAYTSDCIISNTATNGRLLKMLRLTRRPIITYVHELENMAQSLNRHRDVDLSIKHTDLFLFPSRAVSQFLQSTYAISLDKQLGLPYYFPKEAVASPTPKGMARKEFADRYGLSPDTLWVAGMGTISLRKGVDHFIETCRMAHEQHLPFSFIWIGDYEDAAGKEFFAEKIRVLGNTNLVFTGRLDNNPENLLPFDIFFTSSREDPYPLVVLEAAYVKVPGICFEKSGGIVEFVEDDAGWIVPGFSPENVVKLLQFLSHNRDMITSKGQTAYNKAIKRHSDKNHIRQAFESAIETVLPTGKQEKTQA